MKKKILEILKSKKEGIVITEFLNLMPEIKDIYAMYMPVKEGVNPNILWLSGVNKEFISVFNELLQGDIISWDIEDFYILLFDGNPIYNLPIATPEMANSDIACWLPIKIKLN